MKEGEEKLKTTLALSVAALGIVFGDIGTSPLYAINQIFFGHSHLPASRMNIFGAISIVFWALALIISVKYMVLALRADNEGEGGVFALSSLISQISRRKTKPVFVVSALLIFAAGLLLGDGIITPAISVISAAEGMTLITPHLSSFILPVTVAILTVLFLIQSKGSAKVGRMFGPVMIVWFLVIGALGLAQIVAHPQILLAVNPLYALRALTHLAIYKIFLLLGAVMLVMTGAEALYADMGHFGKRPIRLAWFYLALPMLLLNYFGQGAYLLGRTGVMHQNIFYSMVPGAALIAMVVLATVATVIASQALISGAFSLVAQGIALGYFPRLRITQTHREFEGQRYVGFVNWAMYAGTVALVLIFRSSSGLASAYGLAVMGNMVITSLALFLVARYLWHWTARRTTIVMLPFFLIDLTFFTANSLKFFKGAFVPIALGLILVLIMKTWKWGKAETDEAEHKHETVTIRDLVNMKDKSLEDLPRSVVIMTPHPVEHLQDHVPLLEQMFLERYGMPARHIIFLTVVQQRVPYARGERYHVMKFYDDERKGSIVAVKMNFGFMERPNVEKYLEGLSKHHEINIDEHPSQWLVHVIDDRIITRRGMGISKRFVVWLFQAMERNSISAVDYFGLGDRVRLSSEVLPVRMRK